ncbi:SpoIVB peptidase [Sulfobacillus acidophilus DSM 10332]|uniref:SpoIVB peptidase n=1 Tax=Sulfobacillus acidophilus (strain ATCC 700253 / DSM 10332 / NAL) TaxID=679936 RepID=G8TYU5_SULAD|nr:SpoIVB peptidase [Sulfobacillus acidophilus DSM 10332]
MGWLKRMFAVLLALAVLTVGVWPSMARIWLWPTALWLPRGETVAMPWSRWIPVALKLNQGPEVVIRHAAHLDFVGLDDGHYQLDVKLFGWIPWRSLPVTVQNPLRVVPGGESVGIVARTEGLIVTDTLPVLTGRQAVDPALAAGISRGDVIVAANGHQALTIRQFTAFVQRAGRDHRPLRITVKTRYAVKQVYLRPVWSSHDKRWAVGLKLQDRTSGVGTLSFYNPRTLQYFALGHSMTDGLSRRPVSVSGHILGADIVGIVPATAHSPGQKVGILAGSQNIEGTVSDNNAFGITGNLSHPPIWGPQHPLPLAMPDQVHSGPAEIITVLSGQTPEAYSIDILKTVPQYAPHIKGILFRVTDPRLISRTGGVVQGMSGSPIIQDQRVVGAVTHVILSRPTLGYGCYAYWMVLTHQESSALAS